MAFVELREEGNWTIQGVVAASPEGTPVSRPMVKWAAAVSPESYVVVEATVQKPLEPVKSCRVSLYELHIQKLYVLAAAPAMLGLTLAAANRPVANFSDEDQAADQTVEEGVEKLNVAGGETAAIPSASMLTHLNNIVMHKRAPVQQAIADIRTEVKDLFRTYLKSRRFREFEPPCLIGAASEGGANVFRMPYFDKEAYLVSEATCRKGTPGREPWLQLTNFRHNRPNSTSRWKLLVAGSECAALVLSFGPRSQTLLVI